MTGGEERDTVKAEITAGPVWCHLASHLGSPSPDLVSTCAKNSIHEHDKQGENLVEHKTFTKEEQHHITILVTSSTSGVNEH